MAATYAHDAHGRRIEKIVGTAVTRYIYDGPDIVLEYDASSGSNLLAARFAHGPLTDQPLSMQRGGQSYYFHANHHGSIIRITDAAGLTVNEYTYDAYGNALMAVEGIDNPFRYTGREWDAETGLLYYRARTYDPATGRFLQLDPIEFGAGDVNLYRYVVNNPVNAIDPFGLECAAWGGRVTCDVPGTDLTIDFPRPEGWPDLINNEHNLHHEYERQIPLNGADPECVMGGIIDNPVPGPADDRPASVDGTVNDATPQELEILGDILAFLATRNIYGSYNYSPVLSYTDAGRQIMVNVTLPDHPLGSGYVVRFIDGSTVRNIGEGIGLLQSRYNRYADELINNVWDDLTQSAIDDCGVCQ